MNYQDIFAATHKAGYTHFEGKTFTCKQKVELLPNAGTTVDKGGIELFFKTGCNGKGNHISIISKDDEKLLETKSPVLFLEIFPIVFPVKRTLSSNCFS